MRLRADDDALAAGGAGLVGVLVGVGGARVVRGAAAGAAAVELDAVAGARDAEAVAGAAGADGGDAGGARAGAARRRERRDVGRDIGVVVRLVLGVVLLGLFGVDGGGGEAAGELLDGRVVGVVGGGQVARLVGLDGLGRDDLVRRERAALGDVGRRAARVALAGRRLGRAGLACGDVEDVQVAAGGGLGGELAGRVVRGEVAIDDVLGACQTFSW